MLTREWVRATEKRNRAHRTPRRIRFTVPPGDAVLPMERNNDVVSDSWENLKSTFVRQNRRPGKCREGAPAVQILLFEANGENLTRLARPWTQGGRET